MILRPTQGVHQVAGGRTWPWQCGVAPQCCSRYVGPCMYMLVCKSFNHSVTAALATCTFCMCSRQGTHPDNSTSIGKGIWVENTHLTNGIFDVDTDRGCGHPRKPRGS